MFDATKLLGALLEHRSAPSAGDRLGNALGQGGGLGRGGNPLGQVLSQLGGGVAGSPTGGGLGGGGNPLGRLLAQFGGGRGAVGGGLLAVLGSLAYSALQAGQQGGTDGAADVAAAPPPPGTPEEVHRSATLVLKAMIQAAKADGQLDAREIERITGKLHEAGEDPEARDFVLREMSGPVDVEGLAREARTPKEAAEAYAASLMAIEVDTQAERDYLARLADALGLSQPTVAYIHHSLGVPA